MSLGIRINRILLYRKFENSKTSCSMLIRKELKQIGWIMKKNKAKLRKFTLWL